MFVRDPQTGRAINPRLIYAIEVLGKTFVPRVYTSSVTFAASAAGATLTSQLNERVPSDTVIKSVEYVIRQDHLFLGNVLKPQRDAFFQACSYFEVEAETFGAPPSECVKVTADGPMPIESFARSPMNSNQCFRGAFGDDFVLGRDMNLRIVTRTINALAGDEIPTTVFYTFKVEQIDDCCIRSIDMAKAMEYLQARYAVLAGGR